MSGRLDFHQFRSAERRNQRRQLAEPLNHRIGPHLSDWRRPRMWAPHPAHTELLRPPHVVNRPVPDHQRSLRGDAEAIEYVQKRLSMRLAVAQVRCVSAYIEQFE